MAFNILLLDPTVYGATDVYFAGQKEGTKTIKTCREWATSENAHLYFNLGVFDMKTGESNCYVKGTHMISDSSGATHGNIGGYSDILSINSSNQCKGYSNGIVIGKISINKPMGGSRTRNGIGITKRGHIIIAQCGHNATEKNFCEAVNAYVSARSQKVDLFLLEDGGGSTQEYSALSKLNFAPEGGRRVATIVCVKFLALPTVVYPVYKNRPQCNDNLIVQTLLGGLECDGKFGTLSAARLTSAQRALSLPAPMQNGIADGLTLHRLGIPTNF